MGADPRGPADPLEQLRADRERHRAEERADAPSSSAPPPDWHHDTLELDLDDLRHESAEQPVVEGSVLRSRTHRAGRSAVRQGPGVAARTVHGVRRVRVPTGLVVGLVLLVGAGATSAALDGSGSSPQPSQEQTTTQTVTQTGTGTTQHETTTASEQPAPGAGPAARGPEGGPGGGPAAGPGTGPAAGPGAGPAGAPGRP